MMPSYSRVLVTGAAGFIGTHLCQALSAQGTTVHAVSLDGRLPKVIGNDKNIVVHHADITDLVAVTRAMGAAQPDVVFHLAAYGTLTQERDIVPMIDVNIRGTQNLLTAGAVVGCHSFVHTGSVKEYTPRREPITEQVAIQPWDNYAATKAAAGFFCQLAAARLGLPVTVLRFSPAYGPGEAASRFLPAAIKAALEGTPFTISVSSLVRNFTYIDDIVSAFLCAAAAPRTGYDEFNIGAPQAHSFEDILSAVEHATGQTITRVVDTPPTQKDDSWVVDSTKANRFLGWQAKTSLQEGVAQTVEWYREKIMVNDSV